MTNPNGPARLRRLLAKPGVTVELGKHPGAPEMLVGYRGQERIVVLEAGPDDYGIRLVDELAQESVELPERQPELFMAASAGVAAALAAMTAVATSDDPAARQKIRAERQAKLDRKITRLRGRADRLDAQAEAKQAAYNHYRGDIAFLTQPASPVSSFGKFRKRLGDRYDQGVKLQVEAAELRERADWLQSQGVRVKGDAEDRHQAEREAADRRYGVGSRVYDHVFGWGEVVRVYSKSFRVKWERTGSVFSRDKSYFV